MLASGRFCGLPWRRITVQADDTCSVDMRPLREMTDAARARQSVNQNTVQRIIARIRPLYTVNHGVYISLTRCYRQS